MVKKSEQGDDEPVIEDVKASETVQNSISILKESTIKESSIAAMAQNPDAAGANEFEDHSEDIFYNFQLALQIIDDFISGANLKETQKQKLTDDMKKERKKLLSCLLIDCNMRLAEYTKFYQDNASAKENYKKVIDLCKEFPEGNERI